MINCKTILYFIILLFTVGQSYSQSTLFMTDSVRTTEVSLSYFDGSFEKQLALNLAFAGKIRLDVNAGNIYESGENIEIHSNDRRVSGTLTAPLYVQSKIFPVNFALQGHYDRFFSNNITAKNQYSFHLVASHHFRKKSLALSPLISYGKIFRPSIGNNNTLYLGMELEYNKLVFRFSGLANGVGSASRFYLGIKFGKKKKPNFKRVDLQPSPIPSAQTKKTQQPIINTKVANKSSELNNRAVELNNKEDRLNQLALELDNREQSLNARKSELDNLTNDLNERIKTIESREAQIAAIEASIKEKQVEPKQITETPPVAVEMVTIQFSAQGRNKTFPRVAEIGQITTQRVPNKSLFRYRVTVPKSNQNATIRQLSALGYKGAFVVKS